MVRREVTLQFTLRKPWWTHLAFAGARIAAALGVPVDVDRFSRWLGGHFKIETREV